MKKIYFISGLPRSGTTLLSSILKQNPKFHAGITDMLLPMVKLIYEGDGTASTHILTDDQKSWMTRDGIESLYKKISKPCVFNTNRGWTTYLPMIEMFEPDFKVIICYRSVPDILNSFEHVHHRNPFEPKPFYNNEITANVFERCAYLMHSDSGIVKNTLQFMQQAAMMERYKKNLLFLQYEVLVNYPEEVMRLIYEFLEEPFINHDFNNVEDSYPDYDKLLNVIDLHKVRKHVAPSNIEFLIPPELEHLYKQYNFWDDPSFSHIKKNRRWIEAT